jgi:hypothetical protein
MLLRTPLLAALAVSAVLGVGAPAAGAIPLGTAGAIPLAVPACVTATTEGQGRVGGVANQSCVGAGGLSFIGPSSAISTVIGPTIITPAFTGVVVVSGGNVAIGP